MDTSLPILRFDAWHLLEGGEASTGHRFSALTDLGRGPDFKALAA